MDPVTSGSDLEEGEIDDADNSEIEIISEKLVKLPPSGVKKMGLAVDVPVRKRSDWEEGIIDIKSKRRKSSCESGPLVPLRVQEAISGRSQKPQKPGSYNGRSPKSYQQTNQHRNTNVHRRHFELKINAKSSFRTPNQYNVSTQNFKEALPFLPGISIVKEGIDDKKQSP